MSKIKEAFSQPGSFIAFLTAGDPDENTTIECIKALVSAGTDLIEIGVPFSDPCAEGPVIEAADLRALEAGMNLNKVFDIVKTIRDDQIDTPIVLLTYYNPVYKYGTEDFMKRLKEVGGDGIIMPDVPYEESEEIREITRKHGIDLVSLVSPTSNERIREIAQNTDGFLYVVSSMGTTGIRTKITTDIPSMIKEIRAVSDIPTAVGFGIATPEQAEKMCEDADGVIVGSRIVKLIHESGEEAAKNLYDYAAQMKKAAVRGATHREDLR